MRDWFELLFWLILMGMGYIFIGAAERVFKERNKEHRTWCIKEYKSNKKKYNFKTKKQLQNWCQTEYNKKYNKDNE